MNFIRTYTVDKKNTGEILPASGRYASEDISCPYCQASYSDENMSENETIGVICIECGCTFSACMRSTVRYFTAKVSSKLIEDLERD
jgi:transposase-like protein